MLNNQLAPERRDWGGIMLGSLPTGSGVVFEVVTLDERIGPEAVALLIDDPSRFRKRMDWKVRL